MSKPAPARANFAPWIPLFSSLFRPEDGLIELRALPTRQRVFLQPGDNAGIQRFIAHQRQNIFFGVAARKDSSNGRLENCSALRVLFADLDFKNFPDAATAEHRLTGFSLRPSFVVRSGGGLHLYWLLDHPLDLGGHHANCRQLLRRLAVAIAADITAAEPARVLRLPGTLNYKYDPPRQVVLDPSNDMLEYAIEDFDELLPPEPEPARPAPVPFPPSRPRTNGRDDPMGRARLYARRLPPAIEGQHGDNDTFRAACKLFRGFDLSDEDAFIILNDEWNSRCQPPWSEAELREKIRNAARYGHEPIGEKLNASKPPRASNNNGKTRPFLKEEPVVEPADQWHVPSHWKRLDLADLHEWQCEPLVPIVDGIIARGNLVYVAAETQTGKTLLGFYVARKLPHGGKLFEKYTITPVDRVLYLVLEDPARRAKDRLLDTDHEFVGPVDRERCIFHIAPGFSLPQMFAWLEDVITSERREVVFLDTYQKATPGLISFDDEKQSIILHKLADLTRRLNITLIILDHVRKRQQNGKRNELTIDDIKGTGGKAQNADCVILMERTPDKKQIKFQSYSKDFDQPVRILLNVAPKGSTEPKFMYAADLDAFGSGAAAKGNANRERVLAAFKPGERLSSSEVAQRTGFVESTARKHLSHLTNERRLDSVGEGKHRRYWRPDSAEENRT